MYKMIIADDEASVRNRLKKILLPNDMGIELSGEAEDGLEALEVFEAVKPNIVIMDINMPSKNGLEVACEMIKRDRDVKIIIITGYNEFEYAQQALKIGAFDLQTKPVEQGVINSAVKRACAELEAVREEKIKMSKIEKMIAESMPVLKEKFIKSLLDGEQTINEEAIKDRLDYLDIDLENIYFNTAVMIPENKGFENKSLENKGSVNNDSGNRAVQKKGCENTVADNMGTRKKNNEILENDILMFAVKNVTEEILGGIGIKTLIYNGSLNNMIVLMSYADRSIPAIIDSTFADIMDKLKFYLNIESFTGIGEETTSIGSISESFKSACEALNYRNIFGHNNVVNIKDINRIENTRPIYSSREIDDILASFKTGDMEELEQRIKNVLNRVISASMGNIEIVRRMFIELTASIVRVCGELGIDDSCLYGKDDPYRKIMSFSNIVELKNWVLHVYGELMQNLREKRSNKVNRMVEMARKYIVEHYQEENLNLKMVSDHLGLSSVYFCQLFNQQIGVGFSEYLNSIRIDQARKLLKDTSLKVYEIAYKVGYSNPKHFNLIFKKVSGMTPVEYRNTADIVS